MLILRAIRKVPSCVDFRAEGVFCEKLLTEAMKNGLDISFPRKSGYTMRGTVQAAEYRSLCKIARRLGLKMRIEKKHGIYFTLKRHRDKIGFAAGAIFAAAVVLFLNLFVWEINISGNKAVSSEEIMATLANSGLKTGTLRTAHDARKIEWNIMNDNKEIAWATVNIQGCCVNVVVSETRREAEMKYDDDKPVNIIAAKYGVIRKMDVFDGQGVVKVGDAVMKGDLLVSATFEDRHGKLTLKHSRARVMAETDYEITVEFPLEQVIETTGGVKKLVKGIEIMGLSIPLGSSRGCEGLPAEKEEKELYFLWIRLPIKELCTKYFAVKQNTITYTAEQAKGGAFQLLEQRETEEMNEMEIISRTVQEKIADGKYIITATYDCIMNIAQEQDILSDVPWENTDDIS